MIGLWLAREPHVVNVRQPRGTRRPSPPSRGGSPPAKKSGGGCLLFIMLLAIAVMYLAAKR